MQLDKEKNKEKMCDCLNSTEIFEVVSSLGLAAVRAGRNGFKMRGSA